MQNGLQNWSAMSFILHQINEYHPFVPKSSLPHSQRHNCMSTHDTCTYSGILSRIKTMLRRHYRKTSSPETGTQCVCKKDRKCLHYHIFLNSTKDNCKCSVENWKCRSTVRPIFSAIDLNHLINQHGHQAIINSDCLFLLPKH